MSDITQWQAQPLTPEMREQHFAQTRSYSGELERTGRAYRRTGFITGAAGMAVGVLGLACAAFVLSRPVSPPRYIAVDSSTGWIGETVGASDAPKLFKDRVIEAAIRSYVEDREAFTPEADDLAFHRVAIKSAPAEQARYAEAHDPRRSPTTAPFAVYGRGGFARVSNFHMTRRGEDPRTHTIDYLVRFQKLVSKAGSLQPIASWTAEISFQFHPELTMDLQDRLLNEPGLVVLSYSSYPDTEAARQ